MKPEKMTPAHHSPNFAELVCSNSLRSDELTNAVGLLKEELRELGSLVMRCADAHRVAAGGALAVDREGFSAAVTEAIRSHPNIELIAEEVTDIPAGEVIIASGPLTSDVLAEKLAALSGEDAPLHFFDAAAPIVTLESVDMDSAFYASRYDKGTADYVNCPMTRDEYLAFWQALCAAEQAPVHGFDDGGVFEGCMTASMNNMFTSFTGENEEFYEELEETLILADAGVETSEKAVENLRALVKQRGLRAGEPVREAFIEVMADLLDVGDRELKLSTKPSIILMVGVNGVGKTTTIGKMAAKMTAEGKKVLLVAGDTFRAAAGEQLSIWAERAGADIVRHEEGSDPAAVVFDGIAAAKARGADVIIVDTAGRLHNKANLMNELNKMSRIISRELPDADRETLLVLDATTGQNGLIQAKQFKETADISGIVLTKLDGTAKGGIVFAIAQELQLPVKYVGVGEGVDDLMLRMFSRCLR